MFASSCPRFVQSRPINSLFRSHLSSVIRLNSAPHLSRARHFLIQKQKFCRIHHQQAMSSSSDIFIHPSNYPLARRDDTVVDDFHGTKVFDPYRWLEDPDSEETQAFVQQLNSISEPFLNATDIREKMRATLTKLWDYEKYGCTGKHGKFYYYYYNSGLQNQSVLYQQEKYDEKGKVFLDPNTLSEDGTTSIRMSQWTEDGTIFAYGISEKGSDWANIKFMKNNGEEISDTIVGVKFSDLAWTSDNAGIFYSRYPEHKSATEGSSVEKHEFHSLFYHKMGTDSKEDVLVAEFRHNPNFMVSGSVTEDGTLLLVRIDEGCSPNNDLYYYDLKAVKNQISGKIELKPFFDKFDAKYSYVDHEGDTALILTNHNAPMFKLIRVKLETARLGPDHWETVIPEDEQRKLVFAEPVAKDKLIVEYLEDVKSAVYVHDLKTGKQFYQIPLDIGTFSGLYARKFDTEMFFSFESFFTPTIIYRVDFSKYKHDEPVKPEITRVVKIPGMDENKFEAKQVFYPSKDGTKIPMFILKNKDTPLDGQNPTILNGYGGFNFADTPSFSISRLFFLNHFKGIIATANLRGGSEYGEKWHEAGMLEKKQNVFDDFIAGAEYLIQNGYTNPKKLAIHGGSNGGLLVGACSQQRPDLYGAVLNRVGVLDMLRFQKFTIGAAWIPEFGNPNKPEDFKFIYKYSPLHNIKVSPGQQWPATMLMTADHDDRVVPAHTLKYIAQLYYTLQNKAQDFQRNPILARVEVRAGHGSGKPTSKLIAEIVDMYSFLHRVLLTKWQDN